MSLSSKIIFGLGLFFLVTALPVASEYEVSLILSSGLSGAVSPDSATAAMWTLSLRLAALFLLIIGSSLTAIGFMKYRASKKITKNSN
jgi:hypothetical protein